MQGMGAVSKHGACLLFVVMFVVIDYCLLCFTVSNNVYAARGSVIGIFLPASSNSDLVMNVSEISNIMDTSM